MQSQTVLSALLSCVPTLLAQSGPDATAPPTASAVRFIENRGQWPTDARFVARASGLVLGLEPGALAVQLHAEDADRTHQAHLIRLSFAHRARPEPRGVIELPGVHHFLTGSDPAAWRTDVPAYATIAYDEVAPGWSIALRSARGVISYDVHAGPGVAPESIVFHCAGADSIERHGDELWLHTPIGTLRQSAPVAWQLDGERRLPVGCSFVLLDGERYAFSVPDRDPTLPLVIDPGLTFATLLGGTAQELIAAIQRDAAGRPVVAGQSGGGTFPTTPGAFQTTGNNLFITKFTADGSALVFSTFLGTFTSLTYTRHSMVLDASDRPVLCASTSDAAYPTTPGAFATSPRGNSDTVLTVLTADGSGLVYSTFLGGTESDSGQAVAVMPNGDIVVGGSTASANFPRVNATGTMRGFGDAFVSRFSPSFQLVYSSFLGGDDGEGVGRLVATPESDAIAVGFTLSNNFPTTPGAFQRTRRGSGDLFVTRIGVLGQLQFSTLLGSSGNDELAGIARAPDGSIYVAGFASGTDFPTTPGTFRPTGSGSFLTRLRADGTGLVFSTFAPPAANISHFVGGVTVDPFGGAIIAGDVNNSLFPTTPGALDRQHSIPGFLTPDGFVTRFDPHGTTLRYSTYLGHTANERIFAALSDGTGGVYVVGDASNANASSSFPTTPGAFQTTNAGGTDGFLALLDLLPTGAQRFGRGTAGCPGMPVADVTSQPFVGNAGFAFQCARVPPNSIGFFLLTGSGLQSPQVLQGIELWVDPASGAAFHVVTADADGNAAFPLPVPNLPQLVGLGLSAQFAWPDTCAPQGLSASDAIAIVVQPASP